MNERLKNARKELKLSQEYVARQMNLSRPSISAIESGQRKVSVDELVKFSNLYGISVDELANGCTSSDTNTAMFSRAFSELSEIDQKEIMTLINFKRKYKKSI